ncbi:hypothetical protein [Streptomyces halstedii]|uniref:hypothetical protein n=1 Tax=Streptomyces halstedii TaxID=1944 RepID=UPI00381F2C37
MASLTACDGSEGGDDKGTDSVGRIEQNQKRGRGGKTPAFSSTVQTRAAVPGGIPKDRHGRGSDGRQGAKSVTSRTPPRTQQTERNMP